MNSQKATHFRQWATKTLKAHIAKGYTINRHRIKVNQVKIFYIWIRIWIYYGWNSDHNNCKVL